MPREKGTPGGSEIQCATLEGAGTLGATIVWGDQGRRIGISAAHVLPDKGASVFQPSRITHPADSEEIGIVQGVCGGTPYEKRSDYFLDKSNRSDGQYDFAFFEAYQGETSTVIAGGVYPGPPGHVGEPPPLQLRDPRRGDKVKWMGKKTGRLLSGEITDIEFWALVQRGRLFVGTEKLFKIRPDGVLPQPGDSGSALVTTTDNKIVGVLSGKVTDLRCAIGSRIPRDEMDLDSTTYVDEATAEARLEEFLKHESWCVVL
ncbi:hypothetical protein ACFTWD_03130 [Streptomyces sp. NPDC056943]|uniref:hypothetical protein n=1 Tax=Streptomyces sp. NPDC056943 TaxID=3345971 RepID=UPI00362F1683